MLSIPEIATQILNKNLSDLGEDNSRTIFIVGSKAVGKSTLLYSFLDKTDTPRETLVLEYYFGRKSNQKQGIEKTVCHVWEYGGKLNLLSHVLSSVPVRGKFYFCVMVDLSKIKIIWNTLETCIQAMTETYSGPGQTNIPELVIIGGKYDLFKNYVLKTKFFNRCVLPLMTDNIRNRNVVQINLPEIMSIVFDSEIKKLVCSSLRSAALLQNAHLLFYSSKEPQLTRRVKDMFHSLGFGSGAPFKDKNTNFTKPLAVPKASDSWESIGTPACTMQQVKVRHLSRIPPAPEIDAPDVPTTRPQKTHPEPALDKLVLLKYAELRNSEAIDISIHDYLLELH